MYYDHVHDGFVVDRACSFTDLIVSVLDLEDLSVLIVILSSFFFFYLADPVFEHFDYHLIMLIVTMIH